MITTLRNLLQAVPFVPFVIHLGDGRSINVPHPDFVWILPGAGEVFVHDSTAKRTHFLNPRVIISVTKEGEHLQVQE